MKPIGYFRVTVNLIMKAKPGTKLFIWKVVLFAYEWKLMFALRLASIMRIKATQKWPINKVEDKRGYKRTLSPKLVKNFDHLLIVKIW